MVSNQRIPGLGSAYPGPAGGRRTTGLAELLGVSGTNIGWLQLVSFLAAMAAADLIGFVRGGGFPLQAIAQLMIGNVVVTGFALLFFRFIRVEAAAAALTALAYAVVMAGVRMLLYGTMSWNERMLTVMLVGFAWQFLFLLGIVLGVRLIRPAWLGLGIGAAAGQVASGLVATTVWRMVESHMDFSFASEAQNALFNVLSAAVFAGVFWAGLHLSGYREGQAAADAPATGAGLTGRLAEVQQAANFRMVRRLLRWGGVGSVVFGVVAVVVGAQYVQENEINAILILIGVGLFVEGIWILVAPSPTGMIIDGVALIVLGLWNISVTVQDISAGAGGPRAFLILGVWQIIWGIQSFGRYRRFAHVSMAKPAENTLRWVEETAKALAGAGSEAPDVVEFQEKQAKKKAAKWKGKLLPDMAFFAGPEEEIAVGDRANSELTPLGGPTGGEMDAQLRVGTKTLSGKVSQATVDKFQRWKAVTG